MTDYTFDLIVNMELSHFFELIKNLQIFLHLFRLDWEFVSNADSSWLGVYIVFSSLIFWFSSDILKRASFICWQCLLKTFLQVLQSLSLSTFMNIIFDDSNNSWTNLLISDLSLNLCLLYLCSSIHYFLISDVIRKVNLCQKRLIFILTQVNC